MPNQGIKASHTPGPWHLFDLGPAEKAGNYHQTSDGAYRISAERTLFVKLEACSDGYVYGENLANALLITAAPDLLSAAKKALEEGQCSCSIPMRDSGHAVGCWMPGVDEALRAAIAKAEGR